MHDRSRYTGRMAKRPTDPNQLAKMIVDQATKADELPSADLRSQIAKLLGRQGGLSGGPARAAALSPKRRTEIAKRAAATRWAKKGPKNP
jgi:hypothetical protein